MHIGRCPGDEFEVAIQVQRGTRGTKTQMLLEPFPTPDAACSKPKLPLTGRLFFATLLLSALLLGSAAHAACRLALALGLDVSSSVDPQEYNLQMGGLALALLDPNVQALILSQPSAPVALAVYEWSSQFDQNLIVDWQLIQGPDNLQQIAAVLLSRRHAPGTRSTAIGHAIRFGGQLLARAPNCWNLTLDLSGDGKNNDGINPPLAHKGTIFQSATINGLAIDTDAAILDQITDYRPGDLSAYYFEEVIFGTNAFIQTALGFEDFQSAMRRKLLRELNISVSEIQLPENGGSPAALQPASRG